MSTTEESLWLEFDRWWLLINDGKLKLGQENYSDLHLPRSISHHHLVLDYTIMSKRQSPRYRIATYSMTAIVSHVVFPRIVYQLTREIALCDNTAVDFSPPTLIICCRSSPDTLIYANLIKSDITIACFLRLNLIAPLRSRMLPPTSSDFIFSIQTIFALVSHFTYYRSTCTGSIPMRL